MMQQIDSNFLGNNVFMVKIERLIQIDFGLGSGSCSLKVINTECPLLVAVDSYPDRDADLKIYDYQKLTKTHLCYDFSVDSEGVSLSQFHYNKRRKLLTGISVSQRISYYQFAVESLHTPTVKLLRKVRWSPYYASDSSKISRLLNNQTFFR